MREIVHLQAGQCGNQIGAKVKMINVLPCSLGKNSFFFFFSPFEFFAYFIDLGGFTILHVFHIVASSLMILWSRIIISKLKFIVGKIELRPELLPFSSTLVIFI